MTESTADAIPFDEAMKEIVRRVGFTGYTRHSDAVIFQSSTGTIGLPFGALGGRVQIISRGMVEVLITQFSAQLRPRQTP